MTRTGQDEVAVIVPGRVRSYFRTEDGRLINAGLFDPSDRYPAGGLLGTPTDLARLGLALTTGQLLPDAQRRTMWTPATLVGGGRTGHGLGWDVDSAGTAAFVGGTSVGSTAFLYVERKGGVVVALAANVAFWGRDRLALARSIAGLFAAAER
jgi:hypothetical protein